MKKEDIIYVNHFTKEGRFYGGGFFRFIHFINKTTVYVSRVVGFIECWEDVGKRGFPLTHQRWEACSRDRQLVPIEMIREIPRLGAAQ